VRLVLLNIFEGCQFDCNVKIFQSQKKEMRHEIVEEVHWRQYPHLLLELSLHKKEKEEVEFYATPFAALQPPQQRPTELDPHPGRDVWWTGMPVFRSITVGSAP
jgi:hypothetical protein